MWTKDTGSLKFTLTLTITDNPTIKISNPDGGTTPLRLIIDGVTTNPTLTVIEDWTSYSIGSLAPGAHQIEVKLMAIHLGIDRDNFITTADSSATVTPPTGFGGFIFDMLGSGAIPSYCKVDGRPNYPSGTDDYINTKWPLMTFRVKATGTKFHVWTLHNDVRGRASTGAVLGSAGTHAGSGDASVWDWLTMDSPASGATSTVTDIHVSAKGTQDIVGVYQIAGSGTLDTSWTPPARAEWAFYGDSTVAGTVDPVDGNNVWPLLVCLSQDKACVNLGIGGTTVTNSVSGATAGETRTADLTALSSPPATIYILYGSNDIGIGGVTQANFRIAYYNMMNALTTGLSSASFTCLKVLPRNDKTAAQMATYFATIDQACGAAGDGAGHTLTSGQQAQITIIETAPWELAGAAYNSGGSFDTTLFIDGLHPNVAGNVLIKEELFPTVTWTLTASAGANGSISPTGVTTVNDGDTQAFTITPNSGYRIASITVDGSPVATTSPYTFTNVTANHTISCTFTSIIPADTSGSQLTLNRWGRGRTWTYARGSRGKITNKIIWME